MAEAKEKPPKITGEEKEQRGPFKKRRAGVVLSKDEVKLHVTFKESPPLKPQTNNNRNWLPIMGGVAITLAALFFFNGITQNRGK